MKILLIGEYSRLHNSLKEGLTALNHKVKIVASGDDFKLLPVDFSINATTCNDNKIVNFAFKSIRKLTGFDLEKLERGLRFYFLLPELIHFDHVQIINSDAIETFPFLSRFLYKKLFTKIKNRSLLVCGDETPVIDYLLKREFKYSILTSYFNDNSLKKCFEYCLKYTTKKYRKTFDWLSINCQKLITSDLDYKIPMEAMGFQSMLIPNPINIDKIEFKPLEIDDKVIIFLGINKGSAIKKGSVFFEKALEIIEEKYPNKVEIIITRSIPYKQYIEAYNKAHILLDQVYSYDQGYNALEAMAKGKVVFTGAETEFTTHYKLNKRVCINALADTNYLVNELSFLIENPEEIIVIGKRARLFIEKEHNYIRIAERYLEVWNRF